LGAFLFFPPQCPQLCPQINEIWGHFLEQSETAKKDRISRNPQKVNVFGRYGKRNWCRLRDAVRKNSWTAKSPGISGFQSLAVRGACTRPLYPLQVAQMDQPERLGAARRIGTHWRKRDPKNRMVGKSQGERACTWGPMLMLASERSRQFRVGLENGRSGGTRSVGRGPVGTQRPEGTQCPARVEPTEPCRALPQS